MARTLLNDLARRTNTTPQDCLSVVEALRDSDPLLGVKGCRFSLVNPEFLGMQVQTMAEVDDSCKFVVDCGGGAMQVRAALGAGLQVMQEGYTRMGRVKFMVPMISSEHETKVMVGMIQEVAEEYFHSQVRGLG